MKHPYSEDLQLLSKENEDDELSEEDEFENKPKITIGDKTYVEVEEPPEIKSQQEKL